MSLFYFCVFLSIGLTYGQLIGAPVNAKLNTTEPAVVKAVKNISSYLTKQNYNGQWSLVRIVSAQTQVVAGINYKLNLEVTNGTQKLQCYIEVWVRVWLAPPEDYIINKPPTCNKIQRTTTRKMIVS
ncbi:hypothetical protein Btru_039503 [Bulinus truncatus]|nr:hypothetical protein Btru_039503 [Bulinus truncatus]